MPWQQRTALIVPAVLLVFLGVLIVTWAVDNAIHSGQVQRNVSVAGRGIGGQSEASLPATVAAVDGQVSSWPVVVEIEGNEYETTAGDLGLTLDEEQVIDEAMDVGRTGSLLGRPFAWFGSLLGDRTVTPRYTVSESQVATTLQTLQDDAAPDRAAPVEPQVNLTDSGFEVTPGEPGVDLDASKAADDLKAAVEEDFDPDEAIILNIGTADVAPSYSDEDAQALADRANALTSSELTLMADSESRTLTPEQLRNWLAVDLTNDENQISFDKEAAGAAVNEEFSDLTTEPTNATVEWAGNGTRVIPGESGITCCGENVGDKVWTAMNESATEVELEVDVVEPEHTTEDVENWGINEPLGNSEAWQNGAPTTGPAPGFTTFHDPYPAGRIHNIHTMADIVDGAVIPPGGSFSINDHVGQRQCPPFAEGGAILNGEHVTECGGGVSQFATTTFNAAYFGGLDIVEYQAHSEYFSRYPRGREATMGFPAPDLQIENNTQYGVIIKTSYTDTSLTVTLYSTKHIQVRDAGNTESAAGNCTNVTNTRERTFPDGSVETDTFRATYRPGEGEFC